MRGIGVFPLDLEVSDGRNTVVCSTTVELTGDPSVPPELGGPPTPLWLAKVPRAAEVLFSWQDLGGNPTSYNLYEGLLRNKDTHAPLSCNLGGLARGGDRREAALVLGTGSHYYLMSAASCAAEGPSGGDPARSACPP